MFDLLDPRLEGCNLVLELRDAPLQHLAQTPLTGQQALDPPERLDDRINPSGTIAPLPIWK